MDARHHLPKDRYVGRVRVFITCNTHERRMAFANNSVCQFALSELLANTCGSIELSAYCFMPDHVHLLLTGEHAGADIPKVIRAWKQRTGHAYGRDRGYRLWQRDYWDYVLRAYDDVMAIALYIVSDPVRTGLVATAIDYPWWGSQRWSREYLAQHLSRPV
jgi:putative transposase